MLRTVYTGLFDGRNPAVCRHIYCSDRAKSRVMPGAKCEGKKISRRQCMIRVLFVCHGSICRSPMAMFILRDLADREGISDELQIDAAATSREEIGNPVYPPAYRKLNEHGIDASGHHAHQMTRREYDEYDYIIGMDRWNLRNIERIIGEDTEEKVSLILDHTDRPGEVADPWYTDDFDTAYDQILEGCKGLLKELKRQLGE